MRKLIVHEFVSLDGVMQAPGGKEEDRDGGFEYGGWTIPYWHDHIGRAFSDLMKGADAFHAPEWGGGAALYAVYLIPPQLTTAPASQIICLCEPHTASSIPLS